MDLASKGGERLVITDLPTVGVGTRAALVVDMVFFWRSWLI